MTSMLILGLNTTALACVGLAGAIVDDRPIYALGLAYASGVIVSFTSRHDLTLVGIKETKDNDDIRQDRTVDGA
tara:strand:+ start:6449 stop:6670 length:222 start_codon:yes stop_codon:yes gene_type:complete